MKNKPIKKAPFAKVKKGAPQASLKVAKSNQDTPTKRLAHAMKGVK